MAHTFTVTVSDEEFSAWGKIEADPDAWLDDFVQKQARKYILAVVEATLSDITQFLPPADKTTLVTYLVNNDLVMTPWRQWPQNVLRQIAEASLFTFVPVP